MDAAGAPRERRRRKKTTTARRGSGGGGGAADARELQAMLQQRLAEQELLREELEDIRSGATDGDTESVGSDHVGTHADTAAFAYTAAHHAAASHTTAWDDTSTAASNGGGGPVEDRYKQRLARLEQMMASDSSDRRSREATLEQQLSEREGLLHQFESQLQRARSASPQAFASLPAGADLDPAAASANGVLVSTQVPLSPDTDTPPARRYPEGQRHLFSSDSPMSRPMALPGTVSPGASSAGAVAALRRSAARGGTPLAQGQHAMGVAAGAGANPPPPPPSAHAGTGGGSDATSGTGAVGAWAPSSPTPLQRIAASPAQAHAHAQLPRTHSQQTVVHCPVSPGHGSAAAAQQQLARTRSMSQPAQGQGRPLNSPVPPPPQASAATHHHNHHADPQYAPSAPPPAAVGAGGAAAHSSLRRGDYPPGPNGDEQWMREVESVVYAGRGSRGSGHGGAASAPTTPVAPRGGAAGRRVSFDPMHIDDLAVAVSVSGQDTASGGSYDTRSLHADAQPPPSARPTMSPVAHRGTPRAAHAAAATGIEPYPSFHDARSTPVQLVPQHPHPHPPPNDRLDRSYGTYPPSPTTPVPDALSPEASFHKAAGGAGAWDDHSAAPGGVEGAPVGDLVGVVSRTLGKLRGSGVGGPTLRVRSLSEPHPRTFHPTAHGGVSPAATAVLPGTPGGGSWAPPPHALHTSSSSSSIKKHALSEHALHAKLEHYTLLVKQFEETVLKLSGCVDGKVAEVKDWEEKYAVNNAEWEDKYFSTVREWEKKLEEQGAHWQERFSTAVRDLEARRESEGRDWEAKYMAAVRDAHEKVQVAEGDRTAREDAVRRDGDEKIRATIQTWQGRVAAAEQSWEERWSSTNAEWSVRFNDAQAEIARLQSVIQALRDTSDRSDATTDALYVMEEKYSALLAAAQARGEEADRTRSAAQAAALQTQTDLRNDLAVARAALAKKDSELATTLERLTDLTHELDGKEGKIQSLLSQQQELTAELETRLDDVARLRLEQLQTDTAPISEDTRAMIIELKQEYLELYEARKGRDDREVKDFYAYCKEQMSLKERRLEDLKAKAAEESGHAAATEHTLRGRVADLEAKLAAAEADANAERQRCNTAAQRTEASAAARAAVAEKAARQVGVLERALEAALRGKALPADIDPNASTHSAANTRMQTLQTELDALKRTHHSAGIEAQGRIDTLERSLHESELQVTALKAAVAEAPAKEVQALQGRVAELTQCAKADAEALAAAKKEAADLRVEVEATRKDAQEKGRALGMAEEKMKAEFRKQYNDLQEVQSQFGQYEGELTTLRTQLADVQSHADRCRREMEEARLRCSQQAAVVGEISRERDALRSQLVDPAAPAAAAPLSATPSQQQGPHPHPHPVDGSDPSTNAYSYHPQSSSASHAAAATFSPRPSETTMPQPQPQHLSGAPFSVGSAGGPFPTAYSVSSVYPSTQQPRSAGAESQAQPHSQPQQAAAPAFFLQSAAPAPPAFTTHDAATVAIPGVGVNVEPALPQAQHGYEQVQVQVQGPPNTAPHGVAMLPPAGASQVTAPDTTTSQPHPQIYVEAAQAAHHVWPQPQQGGGVAADARGGSPSMFTSVSAGGGGGGGDGLGVYAQGHGHMLHMNSAPPTPRATPAVVDVSVPVQASSHGDLPQALHAGAAFATPGARTGTASTSPAASAPAQRHATPPITEASGPYQPDDQPRGAVAPLPPPQQQQQVLPHNNASPADAAFVPPPPAFDMPPVQAAQAPVAMGVSGVYRTSGGEAPQQHQQIVHQQPMVP